MTLLLITLPGDNGHEVLWPWEQDGELRQRLTMHIIACGCCVLATHPVFGTDVPKSTFTPGCGDGVEVAHALRAHAARKRAAK